MAPCRSGVFPCDSLSVFSAAKWRVSFSRLTPGLRRDACEVTPSFPFPKEQSWEATGGNPQARGCAVSFPCCNAWRCSPKEPAVGAKPQEQG